MKKTTVFISVIFAYVFCTGGYIVPAEKSGVAGVVTRIIGALYVKSVGSNFRVYKKGEFLKDGDLIKTGKGDKAALSLASGMEIKLNEESQITLDPPEPDQRGIGSNIGLRLGQLWFKVLAKRKGAKFNIKTPIAVASIRGTEGDLKQKTKGMMYAKCYSGEFEIENEQGKQTISEGEECSVASGKAPESPKRIFVDEVWQNRVIINKAITLNLKSLSVYVDEPVEVIVRILDSKGAYDSDFKGLLKLFSDSSSVSFSEAKDKWSDKLLLKLVKGGAKCWLKASETGMISVAAIAKDAATGSVSLTVTPKKVKLDKGAPKEKILEVDIENEKGEREKVRFRFKK